MYLSDYHTHTQFSPDAHDPMADMARAAIRAGLDEICFTDHVEPMEWGSTKLRAPYHWSALTDDFEAAQAALGDYLDEALDLAKLGGFTVMGHLTLPLRYFNGMRGLNVSFDPYEDQIRMILQTLIENGRGIELNCNRGDMPLPDEKWLKIYRELGGELITLGTDAHSTQHVGCSIRERQTLLRECGFTRFCTFEKQKPVWHNL